MSISDVIESRKISRILHFTTNLGCLGVLHSRSLNSRQRLPEDEQLKFIFQPNAASRDKDIAWLDYVNLSIERINESFFEVCSRKWHKERDIWWCVLEFSPSILTHPGVHFSTTNNIYTSVVRGEGEQGLEAMFQSPIELWKGNLVYRNQSYLDSWPTCRQAEVLYPVAVSTADLVAIHVRTAAESDEVAAQVGATGHPGVRIVVDDEIFRSAS